MPDVSRVWEILQHSSVGMLTTRFADGLRARPLDARPDRNASVIFFVVDVRGLKDDEVKICPTVCFTVIDADAKAYLSITGDAEVIRDNEVASRIWKSSDKVWWPDGPHDVNVRVLRLVPKMAELWDGPASSAVASYELAKSRITGEKPNLGENRKAIFDLDE
jgi:general stress protein 26